MTEKDWLDAIEPQGMLEYLRSSGKGTDRKLRLFGVACSRRIWSQLDDLGRAAVEMAELYADGLTGAEELRAARLACKFAGSSAAWYAAASSPVVAARNAALSAVAGGSPQVEQMAQAELLRCIFGNPYRDSLAIPPEWISWNGGLVVKLASIIYDKRDFSLALLTALAHALRQAGCDSEAMLAHCQQQGQSHYRGCWVVDALLGKEEMR